MLFNLPLNVMYFLHQFVAVTEHERLLRSSEAGFSSQANAFRQLRHPFGNQWLQGCQARLLDGIVGAQLLQLG